MDLIAEVASDRMLTVSWSYPSSLREQIKAFEVQNMFKYLHISNSYMYMWIAMSCYTP